MTRDFHLSFPPAIHVLLDDLHHLIGPLFLVGGTVRKMLQNKGFSSEFNVLVQRPLSECQKRLVEGGHHSVTMGTKHNSLLLPLKGGKKSGAIEISTVRHRPDHPPTIEEDLLHRDLTVNAMAFAWPEGPLIDPFHGQEDLTEGRIRFVRGVATLEEDPLRALRFFRFAFQLEGTPEETDLYAAEKTLTDVVPRKKVRGEIDRIFSLPLNHAGTHPLVRRFFRSPLVHTILEDVVTIPICAERETLLRRWRRVIGMILGMTHPDKGEEMPLLDLRWAALLHEVGELGCIAREKGSIRSSHRTMAYQVIGEILKTFRFAQRRQRRILHLLQHCDVGLMPTDRVLLRLLKAGAPLEGLFRLIHAREVSILGKLARIGPLGDVTVSCSTRILLDRQLIKTLKRCRTLQQASRQPSPRDLAISGGEILDLVRRPQGSWMGEIIAELLEWISQDLSRNQRGPLQVKVREWVASRQVI